MVSSVALDLYVSLEAHVFQGLLQGPNDPRGRLVDRSLEYVRAKHPRVVVLENVSGLFFRFRGLYDFVLDTLQAEGYVILNRESPLLNTKDHGIPQNRRRVIVGAVRRDSYVPDAFELPEALEHCIQIKALTDDQPRGQPGGLPPRKSPYRKKVQHAYKLARMRGLDPARDDVVVDVGASEKFPKFAVGVFPCITASRGKCRRFFVSTLGTNMTVKIVERCQTFPEGFFRPARCGISKSSYGGMVGNSVSVNVFMRLWPRIFRACGLCQNLPQDYWADAVHAARAQGMAQ